MKVFVEVLCSIYEFVCITESINDLVAAVSRISPHYTVLAT
jgi:hypothetical protein